MSKIEAVIFDMEGVVVDTEPLWDKVAEIFLDRKGFVYQRDIIKPLTMGRTMEDGIKIWQKHYGFSGDTKEQAEERRGIVRQVFETEVSFIPGFMEFFDFIKGKYKTAIATSAEREFIRLFDKRLHLSELFNGHIYSIEDIGFIPKPNPDIYLLATKSISVSPSLSVGIEDSPNGVEAIKRAGMKAIAITNSTTKENLVNADLVVDRFSEIDLDKL